MAFDPFLADFEFHLCAGKPAYPRLHPAPVEIDIVIAGGDCDQIPRFLKRIERREYVGMAVDDRIEFLQRLGFRAPARVRHVRKRLDIGLGEL